MRHYLFGGRDIAISQRFGENPGAYARFTVSAPGGGTQPMHGHNGDDFAAWQGTVLYALEDGVILEASNDLYGYGLTVYLLADSGRGWRYGHFQALDVNQGQRVRKGDRLGLSGNSGNSTGPHLHLGLRPPDPEYTNGYGGYIDPYSTLVALQDEDDALAAGATGGPTQEDDLAAALAAVGGTTMHDLTDEQAKAVCQHLWGKVPFVIGNGIARAYVDELRAGRFRGIPVAGEHAAADGATVQRFRKGVTATNPNVVAVFTPASGAWFAE